MNKLEAITSLSSGESDSIKHGTSTFVFIDDSIVNLKTKRPIDMKNIHEQDWEVFVNPKWYDNIPEVGVLCWLSPEFSDVALICRYDDDVFYNKGGDKWDEVMPIDQNEAKDLILGWEKPKKAVKKKPHLKKVDAQDEKEQIQIDSINKEENSLEKETYISDGVTIEVSQELGKHNSLQPKIKNATVKKRDDVGIHEEDIDIDEIPF